MHNSVRGIRIRITTDKEGVAKFEYGEYWGTKAPDALYDFMWGEEKNWNAQGIGCSGNRNECGEYIPYLDAALVTHRYEVVMSKNADGECVTKLSHRKQLFPLRNIVIDMMFIKKDFEENT